MTIPRRQTLLWTRGDFIVQRHSGGPAGDGFLLTRVRDGGSGEDTLTPPYADAGTALRNACALAQVNGADVWLLDVATQTHERVDCAAQESGVTQRHKEPDVLRWVLSLYPDGEVPVYFCTGWNGHEQLFAARPKITETIQQIKTLEARGGPLLVNAERIDGDGNFVATLEFVSCPHCASPLVIATEPGTPRGWFRIPCPACQADLHREASGELIDVFADPRPASIE